MGAMNDGTSRKRLLFIEDDRDNLEVFSMILDERYAVFGYPSAVDALQAIDVVRPDLLLLDIGMHPVDGLECLKAIRAKPEYRKIPALALTGFGRAVERKRFLDGGFQAVVVKPVLDHRELIAMIDGLLNGARCLDGQETVADATAPRTSKSNGGAQA
jgi:two-component system, chemotaxis family, CheB/CheR fusion protein